MLFLVKICSNADVRSNVVGLKAVSVEVAADSISTSSVHIVRCHVASDLSGKLTTKSLCDSLTSLQLPLF